MAYVKIDGGLYPAAGAEHMRSRKGTQSVGIAKVEQTTTSTADGGVNVVTITLSTGEKYTLEVRNGNRGRPGAAGQDGSAGKPGADGTDGADGNGIKGVVLNEDFTLTLTFDDGTSYTTPSIQGEQGPPGEQGPQGPVGETGPAGPQGPVGETAYEYAVEGGYTGTEDEFKAQLATDYLPLAGGTMGGELRVNGGDAAGGSKIVLETDKGQITNSGTATLLGYTSAGNFVVGHSSAYTLIRGKGSRPAYNGANIALQSDVPTAPVDIGAAAEGHTHLYAGSASAGGPASSAVKFSATKYLQVDLSNQTMFAWDGSGNPTAIGVSGILKVDNGGTGATTAADARTNLDVYSTGEVDSTLDNYALKTDIAATKYVGSATQSITYHKISDFGAWGTGTWYQKGFSMLITSRAGETVWLSIAANDSSTTARAFRLMNTYSKIAGVYYSASESAVYVKAAGWCNNICAHILSNVNGDYVPTVATVSALASDAVEVNILEFGPTSSGLAVGDTSAALLLGGSAERPTYNGNDLALSGDIPAAYTHPTYAARSSGLYKVTVDATGHVTAVAAVTKADLTALGLPAQDTTYDLSGYALTNAANTFNGEQKMVNSQYAPTMNDIASGIGCSLKNARACDNQLIVAELFAPLTAVSDSTIGMSAVSGELPIYKMTGASNGQPTGKTLLAKFTGDGIYEGSTLLSDKYLLKNDGNLILQPASGEGGQIQLQAAKSDTTNNGILIDTANGDFRVIGLESTDGTSKTGYGTVLCIDPYDATITGGYSFDGTAAKATADAIGNPIASTYLPLTGGTLTATSGDTALKLKSQAAASYVDFLDQNGKNLGYIGVNSARQPVFYDSADRVILHSNNYTDYVSDAADADSIVSAVVKGGTTVKYLPITVELDSSDGVTFTATVPGLTSLSSIPYGLELRGIALTTGSTSKNITLNVNGLGAYPMLPYNGSAFSGGTPSSASWLRLGVPYSMLFNGAEWIVFKYSYTT